MEMEDSEHVQPKNQDEESNVEVVIKGDAGQDSQESNKELPDPIHGDDISAIPMEIQEENKTQEPRKLILLVDLDGTLIHSTKHRYKGHLSEDIFEMTFDDKDRKKTTVKVRPYCREFLEAMSRLFEMHVVTLSSRGYALKIVEHLDPEGRFFGGRVISRDELGYRRNKDTYFNVLFRESLPFTIILDNLSDVWDHMGNVVQLKTYKYFKKNGAEPRRNEDDDNLEHIERVLTDVHSRFQSHFKAVGEYLDMRSAIAEYRRSVLKGVKVVVSAEAPWVTKPTALLTKNVVSAMLSRFGAEVQDTVTRETTVIVELWDKTTRVPTIPVVWSSWLYSVLEEWQLPDFGKHLLSY
ncbi:hypothetical protein QR680_007859 [Steinernema hermaphroditum]|uniref:protein-serine/threonine phosphatase n=1 Tax=Steinernema hermaphroditum TaxID=289476 RepID=A0AA39IGW7_9BILA|nr:hypothetical protein QR680_007859 [Steinernema hermaphroditum]